MVDHPADEESAFRALRVPGERGVLGNLSDRVRKLGVRAPSLVAVASVTTLVWLAALGAYGVGYMRRLAEAGAADGGARLLPTLDALFFAFAVTGPLAMLWIVVLAMRRANGMAEAMTAQGESALALAATLANLNETVDELSTATRGQLDGLGKRLDRVLLESAVLIDERVAERVELLARTIDTRTEALDQKIGADVARLTRAVEEERKAVGDLRAELVRRVDQGLAESRARVDRGLAEALARQTEGLADGDALVRDTLEKLTGVVLEGLAAQSRALESELAAPLRTMKAEVEATVQGIAARPPATADELSRLLGEAASAHVAPERKALDGALARIDALSAKAEHLIVLIDRTSRLNPLMDRDPEPQKLLEAPLGEVAAELPFGELPRTVARGALNWTAVVRVLDGEKPARGTRQALLRAAADPDVMRVLDLTARLKVALAEDKVFLEDLRPEPQAAALWSRFARGERGGDVSALGSALQDDVALALTRVRLRGDAEVHAQALRLVSAYGELLSRAVGEIGEDPRLVEMADTPPGRAVLLAGALLNAFEGAEG